MLLSKPRWLCFCCIHLLPLNQWRQSEPISPSSPDVFLWLRHKTPIKCLLKSCKYDFSLFFTRWTYNFQFVATRRLRTAPGWLFAPVSPVAPWVTRMNSGHRFDWSLLIRTGDNRLIFAGHSSLRSARAGPTVSRAGPVSVHCQWHTEKLTSATPLNLHLSGARPPHGVLQKRPRLLSDGLDGCHKPSD